MVNYNSDSKIFYSTKINNENYFSGFSTSDLGDARDLNTIINFFSQQKILFKKIVLLEQIHSINVEVFGKLKNTDRIETIKDSDGVITNNLETILIVRNADCVPLIFADKSTGYIGISHQGWRGSLKNMAAKMVNQFINLKSLPAGRQVKSKVSNLQCAIGPSIGLCCYDVDDDLYYEFMEESENLAKKIFQHRGGRWHLNLPYLNYLQLLEAGVKKENIDFFPFCTKCNSKRFFSRRRAKSNNFAKMFNFVMKL